MGLKPGVSIKARIYTHDMLDNIWRMDADTKFNFLEIKASIDNADDSLHGFLNDGSETSLTKETVTPMETANQLIFRIQRAAEDGLLGDFTYKTKSRLQKLEENTGVTESSTSITEDISLHDIITLLCETSDLDTSLSPVLKQELNDQIRPFLYDTLDPAVLTQYARIHMIPVDLDIKDKVRITLDPGVEYYDVNFVDPTNFIDNNTIIAEYMTREPFSRLEFKVDPGLFLERQDLAEAIKQMLVDYGAIATVSKKWTGITLASERYIQKCAIWKEPMGIQISGFFPVHDSWFSYGNVPEIFTKLVRKSKNFNPFSDPSRILVKNENVVTGYLGVPNPSLIVTIEGPHVKYSLPSKSYPVVLSRGQPEFFILEEFVSPVRSVIVSSKSELDAVLHPSIKIQGNSYFRSYGLLVLNRSSDRVFKLTIERKTEVDEKSLEQSEFYCKLRYIGTQDHLFKTNEQDIYRELLLFYNEFSPVLAASVDKFLTSHGLYFELE
jgi:hypothetical protein